MTDADHEAADGTWRPHVVAIGGASRFAIEQVLRTVPAHVGRCYVVAYTGAGDIVPSVRLASSLPVLLVDAGVAPEPDRIYVVPAGRDATLVHGVFELSTPGDGAHAPLDHLFRSLAIELGADTTCVVLSGGGADGALGLKRVKEHDGLTVAQAPTDAEDPAMPLAAIDTGLVDLVARASEIGDRLAAMSPIDSDALGDEHRRRDAAADTLRDILTLVRIRIGHDFSLYKRPTLYRRIARRMQVCGSATLTDYHRYVRDHPSELSHLLRDFLISVTNFFRDSEAFDALARDVVPKLFAGKTEADQVRVWVAGCATGEEAYSIAMLLLEHAGTLEKPPAIQIFATDIDEHALGEARAGRYAEAIAVDVSPARLARFFVHEGHEYRVSKELRDIVLFSPHNLLRDPPFSRLDLVSCRNLLIYLNREAQDRVLAMFHFGLRPEGHLMLGSSESAEAASLQFGPTEGKTRLFSRRLAPVEVIVPAPVTSARWQPRVPIVPLPADRPAASFGDLHHRIVEYYAPPSVIVNDDLDVLHMSEHAGRYLQFGGGEPTRQLLRLVHPELRVALRTAVYAARQGNGSAEGHTVQFEGEGGETRAVELRVRAIAIPDLGSGLLLVMFDERVGGSARAEEPAHATTIEPVVRELEDDLQHTRDQLRASVEQYETSLEELKASNEELQAINEELRSATEELETSKEELQSVNEELTTLNHELKGKVDEVNRANSDFQNLMTSTDLAVLFLDRALHIKWFTRRSLDLFNLIASDIGRPLAHVTHRLALDDLSDIASDVLANLRVVEREVTTHEGGSFLLRALPYRSLEDRIDGVVLTFVDIGELRRTEAALRASEARFRLALSASPTIATTRDATGACTWAYALGRELPASTQLEPFLGPDEARRLAELEAAASRGRAVQRAELALRIDGATRVFDVRAEPQLADGALVGLVTVGFDISASKQAEAALREIDRRKDEFLATLAHELRNPLTPLRVALDVQKLAPPDPNQTQRTRAIMERQVDHLIALVDDLLDLSRITQGKIEIVRVPVDLRDVIAGAIEDTHALAEELGHRIAVSLPPAPVTVSGDRMRLGQIVVNLVTNACKYTPLGGAIDVETHVDAVTGRAVISVADNGLGFESDQLEEIFELFAQCRDARGRSRGGLGIGLNLVRRLVEIHGGTVRAESPGPSAGSTFTVELPLDG